MHVYICIFLYTYMYVCMCLLVDNNGHFGWRHLYLKNYLKISFNEGGGGGLSKSQALALMCRNKEPL